MAQEFFYDSKKADSNFLFNCREPNGMQRLDVQPAGKFSDHNCSVWRTAWNVTGTMLATSGDDGYVRMWKSMCMFHFGNILLKIN